MTLANVIRCGLLLCISTSMNAAPKFSCAEEIASRTTTCIDLNNVRQNGDLRASQLYRGGPKNVRPTGHFFVADCKKDIAAMQDGDGVNLFAGPFTATNTSKELAYAICAAPRVRKDSTITMF